MKQMNNGDCHSSDCSEIICRGAFWILKNPACSSAPASPWWKPCWGGTGAGFISSSVQEACPCIPYPILLLLLLCLLQQVHHDVCCQVFFPYLIFQAVFLFLFFISSLMVEPRFTCRFFTGWFSTWNPFSRLLKFWWTPDNSKLRWQPFNLA